MTAKTRYAFAVSAVLHISVVLGCILLPISVQAAALSVPSSGMRTIGEAMIKAKAGDTVHVANGVYHERIFVKSGVALVSRIVFGAKLDGMGRGTVVTLGKNSAISGFVIKNGTIGIFSNGAGNVIEKCRIIKNWQTGIITVRHLPKIEDNIIAFNRASGIQGWDVRSTVASINHNTIAYNANHGIAMGGKSNVIIENNVVAYNERYGLKLSDDSEDSEITKNNFYKNLVSWARTPEGNYQFDPAFMSPRGRLDFKPDPSLCCKVKGSDNEDLGTRVSGY
jgi:parallel beta-helix repeat protein